MNIHLEIELSRLRREAFQREAEDARRAKNLLRKPQNPALQDTK